MEGESKTNGGEKEKIEGIKDREGERERERGSRHTQSGMKRGLRNVLPASMGRKGEETLYL